MLPYNLQLTALSSIIEYTKSMPLWTESLMGNMQSIIHSSSPLIELGNWEETRSQYKCNELWWRNIYIYIVLLIRIEYK